MVIGDRRDAFQGSSRNVPLFQSKVLRTHGPPGSRLAQDPHVDGTKGSAVAGLRECYTQHYGNTPKPVWNPDIEQPIDFQGGWAKVPEQEVFDNAFKAQWELFLKHVVKDDPFPWTLKEGAKGVQLAEKGLESWAKRAWVDIPEI